MASFLPPWPYQTATAHAVHEYLVLGTGYNPLMSLWWLLYGRSYGVHAHAEREIFARLGGKTPPLESSPWDHRVLLTTQ